MTMEAGFERREARRRIIFQAATVRMANKGDGNNSFSLRHDSSTQYSSPNNFKLQTSMNNNESPETTKNIWVVEKDSLLGTPPPKTKTYSSSISDDGLMFARQVLALTIGVLLRISMYRADYGMLMVLGSWIMYELCLEIIATRTGLIKLANYPSHGHVMDTLLAIVGPGCPHVIVMFTGRVMDACDRWVKDTIAMSSAFIIARFML